MLVKTKKELDIVLASVGMKHEFDECTGDFSPFDEFKIRWVRGYKKIDMQISDYLKGAPEDVILSIVDLMLDRIKGTWDGESGWDKVVTDYFSSDEFFDKNLHTYLKRAKANDIITEIEDVKVYSSDKQSKKRNSISTIFNVIVLDNEILKAPDDIRRTAINMMYNQIQDGAERFGRESSHVTIPAEDTERFYSWCKENKYYL